MNIKAAYIFKTDGLSILSTAIDGENFNPSRSLIFAGLSSAINTLMKDLGHEDLLSIQVRNGKLIYSVTRGIIFVIHALDKEAEIIGQFLVKQIEFEFFKRYKSYLELEDGGIIDQKQFDVFKAQIRNIYDDLQIIYRKEPNLLRYFPPNIPLSLIERARTLEDDLTAGFPENTIKLARNLYQEYRDHRLKDDILLGLGKFFGHELLKQKYEQKHKIPTQHEILDVLNQISVTLYNQNEQQFIVEICPICRAMTSEKPICDFLSGFIEGGFNNPHIHVREILCKAQGDKNCVFQIESMWN